MNNLEIPNQTHNAEVGRSTLPITTIQSITYDASVFDPIPVSATALHLPVCILVRYQGHAQSGHLALVTQPLDSSTNGKELFTCMRK
jgi:hypothetical protein